MNDDLEQNTTEGEARARGSGGKGIARAGKLCFLCSGHFALDERVFYKIGVSLKKCFREITIIAPSDREMSECEGIKIRRIELRKGVFGRMHRLRSLWKIGKETDADVYQCEEIDAWLVGVLLCRGTDKRVVYDSHECNIVALSSRAPCGFRWMVAALVRCLEGWLARRTELILTANLITRGYYLVLNRFLRISVLYNVPRLSLFKDAEEDGERSYDFCHEGHLRFNRGLEKMVAAIRRLRKDFPEVSLLIVGDVFDAEREWLLAEIEKHGLQENIHISGWLEYPEVGRHVARCRIGLIGMEPTPNNMLAGPPNKLFNYMRYGLPVICPRFPEFVRIVGEENCGIIYESGSEKALYGVMRRAMEDRKSMDELGANGMRAAADRYNWEVAEADLLAAYREIAERAGRIASALGEEGNQES